MKSLVIIIVIVLLLIAGTGIYFISSSSSKDGYSGVTGNSIAKNSDKKTESSSVKTFVITGKNFKFVMNGADNPELKAKQGNKIRIEFTSTDGFHDWVVDEFSAATQRVNSGESTSVEFVADKKGTFEYYCGVGKHREQGMKGNLVVE